MRLLLLFPILCLSNFVVYYTDNVIFVNDSNCVYNFGIMYAPSTQSFISKPLAITSNGMITNISNISNNDTYTFVYKQNEHSSDLLFNIFSSVVIYKNNIMIGTSAVQNNNIIISSPTGEVLYYINQNSQNLQCPLPNKYSYSGILVSNNVSIPNDIMAAGVGVLLPFIGSHPSSDFDLFGIIFAFSVIGAAILIAFCLICVKKMMIKCDER